MMESVISIIIDKEWDSCVSISSLQYLKRARKNCRQLVCILNRKHTEDDREYMKILSQEELLSALYKAIQDNPLYVLYPN